MICCYSIAAQIVAGSGNRTSKVKTTASQITITEYLDWHSTTQCDAHIWKSFVSTHWPSLFVVNLLKLSQERSKTSRRANRSMTRARRPWLSHETCSPAQYTIGSSGFVSQLYDTDRFLFCIFTVLKIFLCFI